MLKLFSILVLVGLNSYSFAQNWKPMTFSETYYFNSEENGQVGVTIDAVSVNGMDTTWHFNRMVEYHDTLPSSPYNCDPSYKATVEAHFLQESVGITAMGTYVFMNPDTFSINPYAALGETWVFSEIENNEEVIAEISEIEEMEIFGILDSVKTILLSDGRTIQFSKNHGIVYFETLNGDAYSLSGIPDRQLGVYPIGRHEIFDFEVGDVFVYFSHGAGGFNAGMSLEKVEIVESNTFEEDSIQLLINSTRYSRTWQLNQGFYTANQPSSYQQTLTFGINLAYPHISDVVPNTYEYNEEIHDFLDGNTLWYYNGTGYNDSPKTIYMDAVNARKVKIVSANKGLDSDIIALAENINTLSIQSVNGTDYGLFKEFNMDSDGINLGDTIFEYDIEEYCDLGYSLAFGEGLGVISLVSNTGLYEEKMVMVGYRKGTEEFGYVPEDSVLISLSTSAVDRLPTLNVFPVPADESLNIGSTQGDAYQIMDMSGRTLINGNLEHNENRKIDISSLVKGFYVGLVFDKTSPIGSFRFIKN